MSSNRAGRPAQIKPNNNIEKKKGGGAIAFRHRNGPRYVSGQLGVSGRGRGPLHDARENRMHPVVSSESPLVRSHSTESRLLNQLSGGGGDEEEDGVAVSSLRRRRRLSSAALGSPSSPSAASSLVGSLLSVSEEAEVESAGWEVTVAPLEGPETEESSGLGLSEGADATWLASAVLPSVRGGESVATVLR